MALLNSIIFYFVLALGIIIFLKLDNRISRVLFVFHEGTIVLLHGFIKKTQKAPQQEIDLARKRAKKLLGKL